MDKHDQSDPDSAFTGNVVNFIELRKYLCSNVSPDLFYLAIHLQQKGQIFFKL